MLVKMLKDDETIGLMAIVSTAINGLNIVLILQLVILYIYSKEMANIKYNAKWVKYQY